VPFPRAGRRYNGSIHGKPELIAIGKGDSYERIYDKQAWQKILDTRDEDRAETGESQ
jgi:hypothetical protein